ncbi:MAG: hypothetical protein FWG92_06520 [Leptospirales bacterium]|nr:hypothetical protein [Leptospirales bacterium]
MIKPLSVFFFCLFAVNLAFANIDMSGVHAYPVPYNPKKSSVRVIQFKGWPTTSGVAKVKMEVFDINGDRVLSRTFSPVSTAQWNARNEKGRLVSPGMYIIKLSLDDPGAAETAENFGRKTIRVLIAY